MYSLTGEVSQPSLPNAEVINIFDNDIMKRDILKEIDKQDSSILPVLFCFQSLAIMRYYVKLATNDDSNYCHLVVDIEDEVFEVKEFQCEKEKGDPFSAYDRMRNIYPAIPSQVINEKLRKGLLEREDLNSILEQFKSDVQDLGSEFTPVLYYPVVVGSLNIHWVKAQVGDEDCVHVKIVTVDGTPHRLAKSQRGCDLYDTIVPF